MAVAVVADHQKGVGILEGTVMARAALVFRDTDFLLEHLLGQEAIHQLQLVAAVAMEAHQLVFRPLELL